jgi:hypothetical protein
MERGLGSEAAWRGGGCGEDAIIEKAPVPERFEAIRSEGPCFSVICGQRSAGKPAGYRYRAALFPTRAYRGGRSSPCSIATPTRFPHSAHDPS